MQKASPLHPLTSLRFFAAAAIVYLHMQDRIFGVPTDGRLGLGVGFFFVLSGFILTYVYRDFAGHSVRSFYVARFARLWPAHVVTLALIVALTQPEKMLFAQYVMTLPYHLTMTQSWLPITGLTIQWNSPSWSISAELFFYLLFPFLARSNRFYLWFAAIVAIVAVTIASVDIFDNPPGKSQAWQYHFTHLIQHHPIVRMFEFAVGVAAGRFFINGGRLPGNPLLLQIGSVIAILAFGYYSKDVQLWLWHAVGVPGFALWSGQSAAAPLFAIAVLSFANPDTQLSKALSWRGLVLLGEISFSTYMVHVVFIRLAHSYGLVETYGRTATAVLVLGLIYGASYLLWRYVEMPGRRGLVEFMTRPSPIKQPDDSGPQNAALPRPLQGMHSRP